MVRESTLQSLGSLLSDSLDLFKNIVEWSLLWIWYLVCQLITEPWFCFFDWFRNNFVYHSCTAGMMNGVPTPPSVLVVINWRFWNRNGCSHYYWLIASFADLWWTVNLFPGKFSILNLIVEGTRKFDINLNPELKIIDENLKHTEIFFMSSRLSWCIALISICL